MSDVNYSLQLEKCRGMMEVDHDIVIVGHSSRAFLPISDRIQMDQLMYEWSEG